MKTKEEYIVNKQEFEVDKTKFFEIGGELYIEISNNEQKKLLKYNQKYNKWVELQFEVDTSINIENKIIETLSSQYIEKMIYRR